MRDVSSIIQSITNCIGILLSGGSTGSAFNTSLCVTETYISGKDHKADDSFGLDISTNTDIKSDRDQIKSYESDTDDSISKMDKIKEEKQEIRYDFTDLKRDRMPRMPTTANRIYSSDSSSDESSGPRMMPRNTNYNALPKFDSPTSPSGYGIQEQPPSVPPRQKIFRRNKTMSSSSILDESSTSGHHDSYMHSPAPPSQPPAINDESVSFRRFRKHIPIE